MAILRRRPLLASVPLAAIVVTPLVWPPLGATSRLPGGLGDWGGFLASTGRVWAGAAIDSALVLIPLGVAVLALPRRESAPVRIDRYDWAALAAGAALVWLVLYDRDLIVGLGTSRGDLPAVIALFTIAAVCGARSLLAVPGYLLVTAMLGTSVAVPILQDQLPSWGLDLVPALPEAVAVTAGLAWMPFSQFLRRAGAVRSLYLAVTVNLLNIADIVLTRYDLHHLGAVEANPIIRAIGWPGKIAFVLLATVALKRIRPGALAWAALALTAVLAWHVGGIIVGSH